MSSSEYFWDLTLIFSLPSPDVHLNITWPSSERPLTLIRSLQTLSQCQLWGLSSGRERWPWAWQFSWQNSVLQVMSAGRAATATSTRGFAVASPGGRGCSQRRWGHSDIKLAISAKTITNDVNLYLSSALTSLTLMSALAQSPPIRWAAEQLHDLYNGTDVEISH